MMPVQHQRQCRFPRYSNIGHSIEPLCSQQVSPKIIMLLFCTVFAVTILCMLQPYRAEINVIAINSRDRPIHTTDERFLSVALDSSLIANGFHGFNMADPRLISAMKPLGGAYLRIGGTMADRLIFDPKSSVGNKSSVPDDDCTYADSLCRVIERNVFTMTSKEWIDLNALAAATNLKIIFDINCLLRFTNGSWDASNAETLIAFSNARGFQLNWQLGNEPNSFKHVFNYTVTATQLAKDFQQLRIILDKYSNYKHSLLVGPDVTRPRPNDWNMIRYLNEFLIGVDGAISAITWHQYYFAGKGAYIESFVNPEIFDLLQLQIDVIKRVAESAEYANMPIWLGETSSAYGGGAPGLSNRYVSMFIWMDKLGLSAKNGLKVVIRQSLFKGYYALIDENYKPNPDWWLSVLYKKLVSSKVVECFSAVDPDVRLYCHCAEKNEYTNKPAVIIYGMNIGTKEAIIRIQETGSKYVKRYQVLGFLLSSNGSLISKYVTLNGKILDFKSNKLPNFTPTNTTTDTIIIPPFMLGFWIISSEDFHVCQ